MPHRRATAQVVSISAFRNRDLIYTLRNLLEQAEAGEVTGLLYTARIGDKDHGIGACGTYADDPLGGLAAMTLAIDTFKTMAKEQKFK